MHDIRAIRDDPAAFDAAMARRGLPACALEIASLDAERRAALTTLGERQAHRNALTRQVGQLRRSGGDAAALEAEAGALRDEMTALEARAASLQSEVDSRLAALPNVLDADVPDGADETANVMVKQHGEPVALSAARQHFELGEALGQMDFTAAAKLAGSRFTVLRGPLARMERALGQWMIDLHVAEHGYEGKPRVPLLVNDATAYGSNQLPKFVEDMFRTTDGRWLIPTAEVPLTNMVAGEIVPEAKLPLRMVALTDCFRSEAGSAGRDTRGMLRQHQFRKVEMVSITRPQDSAAEHERMTVCRRDGAGAAGDCVSPGAALRRGYRVWRGEDVRSGSLAAGAGDVARDQLLLQHARVSGPAHERALSAGGGQGGFRALAERLGGGGWAGADCGDGDLSAAGWLDWRSGGAAAVYGGDDADRRVTAALDLGL